MPTPRALVHLWFAHGEGRAATRSLCPLLVRETGGDEKIEFMVWRRLAVLVFTS